MIHALTVLGDLDVLVSTCRLLLGGAPGFPASTSPSLPSSFLSITASPFLLYVAVCWRSALLVVCGRKGARFNEMTIDMDFEDDWRDGTVLAVSEDDFEDKVRRVA